MILKRSRGIKTIAALVLFSVAQIGMQVGFAEPTVPSTPIPVPQQFIARLTTKNNQPITVNGNSATTGASILTGATIETGADQSATVNLGSLGSLDIAPNTKLVLTYDDQGNVRVVLITGCAVLHAKKKTNGEVATQQGSAGKTDPKTGGVLSFCLPPGASAAVAGPTAAAGAAAGGAGGLFGLGVPATIAIVSAGTAAALTPLAFQSNPSGSQ